MKPSAYPPSNLASKLVQKETNIRRNVHVSSKGTYIVNHSLLAVVLVKPKKPSDKKHWLFIKQLEQGYLTIKGSGGMLSKTLKI